jgi:hypothetical protein
MSRWLVLNSQSGRLIEALSQRNNLSAPAMTKHIKYANEEEGDATDAYIYMLTWTGLVEMSATYQ